MAAADYNTVVQQLYVAYFGRPADTLGLTNFSVALSTAGAPTTIDGLTAAYNTSTTVKNLVDAFGTSAESAALYTGGTLAFVNAIYVNVLNRAADFAGLSFWANAIDHGGLSRGNAALSIMAGALANNSTQGVIDAAVVTNKITVATNFTTAIDTASELIAYVGDTAAATARTMLATVTDTTDTTAFQTTVTNTLSTITNAVVANGTTYTLATGADILTGGTANDTFNAVADTTAANTNVTLSATDKLVGGAGTDTLNIVITGTAPASALNGADVSGIEIVNVRGTTATAAFDASTASGVTTVNADRGTADFSGTKLAAGGHYGIVGNGVVVQGTQSFGYVAAATAATIDISGGGTAGTVTTVGAGLTDTTINNTGANTIGVITDAATKTFTVNSTSGSLTTGAVGLSGTTTTVTLNATGGDIITGTVTAADATATDTVTITGTNKVTTDLSSDAAPTITVTGSGAVTLGTLNAAVTKVDASGQTGGSVTATLDAAITSFKGSAGTSNITTGATTAATAVIAAGAGTSDKLILAAANDVSTLAKGAQYTGFEILQNNKATDQDVSFVTGITSVILNRDDAGAINMTATQAAAVTNLLDNTTAHTVSLATATGTSDVLGLTLKNATATSSADFTTATVDGFETINVASSSGTQGNTTPGNDLGFASAADLTALNVSGAYDLSVSTTNTAKAITIVSTQTGTADLNVSGNVIKGSSITTTANTDTIVTSAAVAGTAGDYATYNAGAGDDAISTTVAAINNTSAATASLKIDGGTGTDTLTITTAASTMTDANFQYLTNIEKLTFSGGGALSITSGGFFDNNFKTTGVTITDTALAAVAASVDLTSFTGAATVTLTDATATTQAMLVNGGSGADTITVSETAATSGNLTIAAGAGNDTIKVTTYGTASLTTGAASIDGGAGQDTITLGTILAAKVGNVTVTEHAGQSTLAAADSITGFTLDTGAALGTVLNFDGTAAVHVTVASAAVTGNTAAVLSYAVSATGLLTFTGTDAASLTVAQKAAAAALMLADVADRAVVFTFTNSDATVDSYVYEHNTGGDSLVKLVGVTALGIDSAATTTLGYVQIT